MRRKWLAVLVIVLVAMLMGYIWFFEVFAIIFAVFDFILLDRSVNEYILGLKELVVPCVIASVAVGIRYLILVLFKF